MQRRHFGLALFVSALLAMQAVAQETPPALTTEPSVTESPSANETTDPGALEAMANRFHVSTSAQIRELSRRLDRFFFDPVAEQASNETLMRLRLGQQYSNGGELDLIQRVYLRLDLPETERRLHLFFSEFDRNDTSERTGDILSGRRDEIRLGLNTGLRYVLSDDRKKNLQFLIGTRLYPRFDPFVEIRGRKTIPAGPLAIHPAQYLYWRNQVGFGETTILDTDLALSVSTRLRLRGEGTFSESSNGYDYLVSLSYAQQIRMRRGFLLAVEMAAHTRPSNDVDHYLASFTWRQLIHDRWLFIEPSLQVRFAEADDYHPSPAFLLVFEATFGENDAVPRALASLPTTLPPQVRQ